MNEKYILGGYVKLTPCKQNSLGGLFSSADTQERGYFLRSSEDERLFPEEGITLPEDLVEIIKKEKRIIFNCEKEEVLIVQEGVVIGYSSLSAEAQIAIIRATSD